MMSTPIAPHWCPPREAEKLTLEEPSASPPSSAQFVDELNRSVWLKAPRLCPVEQPTAPNALCPALDVTETDAEVLLPKLVAAVPNEVAPV